VTEFLSREWLAELDAAARASDRLATLAPDTTLVVEQRVSGGPHGDVTYQLVIDRDGGRVETGSPGAPDIVLLTDYETGLALHHGEVNAQAAIAGRRMKLRGDIERLLGRAEALRALDDVFASVRAHTTAVAPGSGDHQ
jgi:hypothetical protein